MAQSKVSGIAREPAAAFLLDDPAWLAHLRGQQLDLLARQFTRSPFAIALACAFVAYSVRNFAPAYVVAAWTLVLLAVLFTRRAYASRLLRHPSADARRALRNLIWFTFANGVLTGIAAPLFFPVLPHEERVLLTMILVCWTAGGVATAAAYARAFHAYVVPALLPLAALWAVTGVPENIVLAVLIVLFAVIQVLFVIDNERVVRDSFLIRYENERLVAALERERQEVSLARDLAEEANNAKSRFLAAASHDLRQPLHALSLYSAALGLRATDGATEEIARNIEHALNSLSALLDSLLDISKLDAGVVQPEKRRFNVRTVLERIDTDFRAVAHARGLEFRVTPVDADLVTDPVLLERVISNLVDNALKYTRHGGIAVHAQRRDHDVCVSVSDTGIGIPAAERDRIFEEFYQIDNAQRDRTRGMGLGLAIVRRLAHLLHLRVELGSEVGRGSTFHVMMAEAHEDTRGAPASLAPSEPISRTISGTRVLVIDDEPSVRVGMRALLESWGCRVAACSGHVEAQRLIEDYKLEVDLLIADFRLRQNENGIETVRRLRAVLGQVPALLVSGDTAPERIREAQASGIPLLHKPVPADRLKEAISNVVRR